MTPKQLRLQHPRLIYKRYAITHDDSSVTITHEFLLEPDIVFRPTVTIPLPGIKDPRFREAIAPYAFHLGLVEAISYWKAACPAEFIVEAGALTDAQIRFWYDLFIHGLGEFFYKNNVDFTVPEFLKIKSQGNKENWKDKGDTEKRKNGDLVLVGGGKDSAVTLEILKASDRNVRTMILNPTEAARAAIRVSGLPDPIEVRRTIDPTLPALNARGYLNGHTPFSAYLAFLGSTVAQLYHCEHVIVSNEQSANEGNLVYHGMEINHQYSKSYRFEQSFREYATSYLWDSEAKGPNYFSMLRPLNNLQIGLLFSTLPDYFSHFRSCNVGSGTGVWCGACAKCAFTYLTLSPFVSHEQMVASFGGDLLTREEIINHVRALVGLVPIKPFECVGTRDEGKLAVVLTIETYLKESREVPEGLLMIKSDLALTDAEVAKLKEIVMDNWGDTYNLPPEHLSLLRHAWDRVKAKLSYS